MDAIELLAHGLLLGLRGLKLAGHAQASAMSSADLRGTAHMLSCGLLGARWDRKQRAADWSEVSKAWEEAAARAPALYGELDAKDQLELITDNAEAFVVREKLWAEAKRSIDLATYYVQGDETGKRAASALIAAAKRGVRVRLIADEYVMRKKDFEGKGSLGLVEELRAGGVEVVLWKDPARPYDAQHRKVLVVDGEHLLIGGRNIADHYAGPEWRDVELLLHGPSVALAKPLIDRTFAGEPEPPLAPGSPFVATMPADLLAHANALYLLQSIRAAQRTFDLENAYYFSHDAVLRALADAVQRGVRVRVMTNSAESNDLDFANWRLYAGIPPMLDAGIEVWLRRGRGRTLHCKYFVGDGERVSLGSSNLDYYSPRHSTECNLQVRSGALGERLSAWFERGLGEADRAERGAVEAVMGGLGFSKSFDRWLRDQQ